MADKLESNPVMMEMARHLSENNSKISSKCAVLYGGSAENGYPVYKILKKKVWGLLHKHGIDAGENFDIITDVLSKLPAPKLTSTKKRYSNLEAALWGVEKDKLVSKKQAGVLWKRASLFFARNSKIAAIVVGDKISSKSVLLSVESLIVSFKQSELDKKELDNLKKLLAMRKKVTKEVKEIDTRIYSRALEAEKKAKQFGWQVDYKAIQKQS